MKAAVWHGPRELRVEEVAEPEPRAPGDAVVEVAYCGICGTDLHEYTEGPVLLSRTPHPLTGECIPLALGHEISGTVVAVAADVDPELLGARVAVDPAWHCGACARCAAGDHHLCRRAGAVGLASHGGLATLVRVPATGLVRIPDHVPLVAAALAEPLAVALHAVSRGRVAPGDSVVVAGFGPIGAAVTSSAIAAGAAGVLVVEPLAGRRARAIELGATAALPATETLRHDIRAATGGAGADVAFECSGRSEVLRSLVSAIRPGGRVVLVGLSSGAVEIEPGRVMAGELELIGSRGSRNDIARAVALLATGRLDAGALLTTRFPLDAARDAFETLASAPGDHLKTVVEVRGEGDAHQVND